MIRFVDSCDNNFESVEKFCSSNGEIKRRLLSSFINFSEEFFEKVNIMIIFQRIDEIFKLQITFPFQRSRTKHPIFRESHIAYHEYELILPVIFK